MRAMQLQTVQAQARRTAGSFRELVPHADQPGTIERHRRMLVG